MKRFLQLSLAAMMVLAVSCNKDKPAASKVPEGAVDLGIEMTREDGTTYKIYWAESNLNFKNGLCTKPEDYGDYYAWGETVPKERFDLSNYKWCDYQEKMTKYFLGDEKSVLDEGDDAAHVKLGGRWRMPTRAEWDKLVEVCSWKWSDENGVNGYKVMGPNGNEIFLPAAGVMDKTELDFEATRGYYWSSNNSVDAFSNSAYDLYFANTKHYSISTVGRQYGCSVRPVWEK